MKPETPIPRRAGVAIPVFSLRSAAGYGVGQFSDLKRLADWARRCGLSLIQILPICDTSATLSWRDSYPYSGISVFALHPLYLDLAPLEHCYSPAQKKALRAQQAALNALPQVDYEQVMRLKAKYVQIAYEHEGAKVLRSNDFKAFFEARSEWLPAYAAFCHLRNRFKTADFTQWQEFAVFDAPKIAALTHPQSPVYPSIAIHYYLQYLLHLQLQEAALYCRTQGIVLKGDLPIGIARHSCDAWMAPHLYNMNAQAGAPPDAFSATGQNWGFPTYNWAAMAAHGYRWWIQRLQAMATYFDAFRIDHILGFFRIWQIPQHAVQGLLGTFAPALPLSIGEITQAGAWLDTHRLCRPYIRPHILRELFGGNAPAITRTYFEEYRSHHYRFKPQFDSQQKIVTYFEQQPVADNSLKEKLLALHNEVVLIADPQQPAHYHPRIAMHYSRSYQDLDEAQKQALDRLYIDFFYHRHNEFWQQQALQKLPALCNATSMLVCGEDLGMVPACVPNVMQRLGILSLIIERMPCDSNVEFAALQNAPVQAVCSPGTHDTDVLRAWWNQNSAAAQRYYNQILEQPGTAPAECNSFIINKIIDAHLRSPAALAIFPLQDLLATDEHLCPAHPQSERINVPDNPHHYWRYRMHISIEDLQKEAAFNSRLKTMVAASGR
ncbi:hypothetical protein FACS1894156_3940 [Bacteroidia bacterium]|nr:hypothetical protein FACS1894156_3940 [Bacteroidia bacterium]